MTCRFVATHIHGSRQVLIQRTGALVGTGVPPETGFGLVRGGSRILLLYGSPPTEATPDLAVIAWSAESVSVQLPDPLPAGPHQIRVLIAASGTGAGCRETASVDLSSPLDDPLLVITAVPPVAPLGTVIRLEGPPTFHFDHATHSPVRLECADGRGSATLMPVDSGWGNRTLSMSLPTEYECDLAANPVSMIRLGARATGVPIQIIPAVPATGPLEGHFRLLLNGFFVNRETSDHVLEVDGKGDEVFFQVHMAEVTLPSGGVTTATKISKTFGDTNRFSGRVQAGSRSPQGGLKTGDPMGTHERGTLTPSETELPMVLWEGTLQQGLKGVVVVPIPWEEDLTTDSTLRPARADWTAALGGLAATTVTAAASAVLSRIRLLPNIPLPVGEVLELGEILKGDPLPALRITREGVGLFGRSGDVPIGFKRLIPTPPGSGDIDQLFPQMVVLTYETALLGSRTTFLTGEANGVFTMQYAGENMNWNEGDYTLFLQIEEVS